LVANSSLFPKKITALAPVPGRPSSRHSVGPLHGGLLEWRRVAVWRIVTECPNGSTLRRDLTATEPRVQGTRRPGQPMTSSDHRRTSDYEHFSTVVAAGYYVASASSGRSTNSRRSAPLAASGSSSLGSARPICADELQSSQAEAEGPKGRAENVVRIPRAAASSETPRSFGEELPLPARSLARSVAGAMGVLSRSRTRTCPKVEQVRACRCATQVRLKGFATAPRAVSHSTHW